MTTDPASRPVGFAERMLRDDRLVALGGVALISLLSWGYLLAGAGMTMPLERVTWTPGYALVMFVMWWVMMIAMMVPGATPMILMFAMINRHRREGGGKAINVAFFLSGYALAWGAFSLMATAVQYAFDRSGLLSPMMATTDLLFGAAILAIAGVWQLTPLKEVCLRHCRSPMAFITNSWREGRLGALAMGVHHGAYCLGCCWFLMGLLFVGGIMNLYWIAGLAIFVLLEKIVPMGEALARLTGWMLVAWAVGLVVLTAT